MMLLMLYWSTAMLMITIMLLIPSALGPSMKKWMEGASSFECGMSLNSMPRKPFSVRFFLLMLLFIIFDIEITLILMMPMLMPLPAQAMLFSVWFISMLTTGVTYEWIEGSLNWKL